MSQRYSDDGVRQERSGWRCQAISERHRKWGYNCPAVDLDFLVAEYNHRKPVALIEYKHRLAIPPDLNDATYVALADLANGYRDGPLPFLVAVYDSEEWWFRVIPVNERARQHYGHVLGHFLSEQRFVRSLYLLRKRVLEAKDIAAISALNTTVPAMETKRAAENGPRPGLG